MRQLVVPRVMGPTPETKI